MRPFAVLLLVFGAVLALVFAFVSVLGTHETRSAETAGPKVVRPAESGLDAPRQVDLAPVVPPAETLDAQEVRVQVAASADRGAHLGFISGVVVAPNGELVPDARVSLLDLPGGPSQFTDAIRLMNDQDPPKPRQKVTTGPDGAFRFESLAPGNNWSLVVNHDRYTRTEVGPIDVPEDGGVEEKVVLEWGRSFFGVVADAETGLGIPGAVLVLDNPMAAFLPKKRRSQTRKETTTDEHGRFDIPNAGGGRPTLIVTAEGYATQVRNSYDLGFMDDPEPDPWRLQQGRRRKPQETPEVSEPKEVRIELQQGQTIAGRVIGPGQAGLPGVFVEAVFQAGEIGSRGDTISGTDGHFLIEDLGEGLFTVRAELEGFHSTPVQRVEVGSTDVEIVLAEKGSVSGRVVDAATGRPVPNFTCRIRTLHPRSLAWGGVVSQGSFRDRTNGKFTLGGVSEGDYVAEAISKGYASTFSAPFSVTHGNVTSDVVVSLTQGGGVTGVVVDLYSGKPIEGAEIQTNDNNFIDSEIIQMISNMSMSAITKTTVYTDEEGRYSIDLMTPADYQVQIKRSGYTTEILNDVKVGEALVTDLGVHTLSRGALVTGTVVDPDGTPFPGANVTLMPADSNPFGTRPCRTDAHGRYKLQNVRAGVYKLSASRPVGNNANPFAPVVDMRHSEIEITIDDDGTYDFKLVLAPPS